MSFRSFVLILALPCALFAPTGSNAQDRPYEGSAERVGLELRIGTYSPDFDAAHAERFNQFFGNDKGPYVGGEIDIWAYRIPYVGPIGLGLGVGWARYNGRACAANEDGTCGGTTDQRARFTLYPLQALAVLRIDVLARKLNVPLIFTPKIGIDYSRFRSTPGGGHGGSFGLHWAAQIALELDVFEPRAARSLDEQWGINHSYLFFELYGSHATSGLNVGTNLSWVAGLGLQL